MQDPTSPPLKIAFLTLYDMSVPLSGAGIRMWSTVEALRRHSSVTCIQVISDTTSLSNFPVNDVKIVSLGTSTRKRCPSWSYLAVLLGLRPRRYFAPRWSRIRRSIAVHAEEPDVLWCYGEDTYLAAPRSWKKCKFVVDFVDYTASRDNELVREYGGNGLRRALSKLDSFAYRRFLLRISRKVDMTVISSRSDKRLLGDLRTKVLPNVYPHWLISEKKVEDSAPTILLNGAYNYLPNRDAFCWFLREIWPRFSIQCPAVGLAIAGKGTENLVLPLDLPNIKVLGTVDSMSEVLREVVLVAVPLRFGSGTRLKVLEALAHAVPVVSTDKGVEGLDLRPNQDVRIANNPDDFAKSMCELVRSEYLRKSIGRAGHSVWAKNFSELSLSLNVDALMQQLFGDGSKTDSLMREV